MILAWPQVGHHIPCPGPKWNFIIPALAPSKPGPKWDIIIPGLAQYGTP